MNRPGNERIGPVEARWQPPRGQKGDKGDKGEPGMSSRVRYSLVMLFALCVGFALFALVGVIVQTRHFEHAQAVQAAQAARERCESLAKIVAIPIPVPLAANPSRQAWASFETAERQRGRQLGCHLPPPRFIHVKGS